jgi:hypothetical protein
LVLGTKKLRRQAKGDDNMTNRFNIENLEGKRLKAKVTNGGKQFSTYVQFAEVSGHPEAAATFKCDVVSAASLVGEEVYVLARGDHEMSGYPKLYVCQTRNGDKFLIGEDGIELIHTKLSEIKTDDLYKEIERRAFEAGYDEGKSAGVRSVTDVGIGIVEPKEVVAGIARDEVVRRAKADIVFLSREDGNYDVPDGPYDPNICNAEFVVNGDKRTVVAIMHGYLSGIVRSRGIAKCDPDDCFNEFIGKAIALRRALGLDVPNEYLNTPAPNGKQAGDVVRNDDGDLRTLVPGESPTTPRKTAHVGSWTGIYSKVINDTARYKR